MAGVEVPLARSRDGRIARWRATATDALPAPSVVVFGSAGWGAIMMISALGGIWMHNSLLMANTFAVASVFFYGGSLAFAPALWLARLWFGHRGKARRFAGGTVIIALMSHAAAAGIFALQYRIFYAHWHESFPSVIWFFQFGFTSAGAIYAFTVGSLYYYWPFACLAFIGFGAWFASRGNAQAH